MTNIVVWAVHEIASRVLSEMVPTQREPDRPMSFGIRIKQRDILMLGLFSIEEITLILQLLYFISGMVLAAIGLYGTVQIKLLKKSIKLNSKHATGEKAIEFVLHYLSSNRSLLNKFIEKCKEINTPYAYPGPINNFLPHEIGADFLHEHKKRKSLAEEWVPLLNDLEIISSAFVTGVADEKIGFQCIGRSFCKDVIDLYDILSGTNIYEDMNYYSNIVKLFRVWISRLISRDFERKEKQFKVNKEQLEKIFKIRDDEIPAIGPRL